MKQEFVVENLKDVPPRPIKPRECKCGCGNTFQPTSSNMVFLNKKHGDFYNYHFVKKPKRKVQNEIEKIHRKNDRICAKYVDANNGKPVVCYWESFAADGFNHRYVQGSNTEEGVKWIYTYKHMYTIFREDNMLKIKIKKR